MEASDQREPVALGIDEAGRGCVLGPLVYGMACWPLSFDERAKSLGFKDSKQLTEKRRSCLSQTLSTTDEISWLTLSLNAEQLSRLMKSGINLNQISHTMILAMMERATQVFEIDSAFIDTVGPASSLAKLINRHFSRVPCCVVERADDKFLQVSAASIAAKVERDKSIIDFANQCQTANMPAPGSGYSSDPTTIAFLEQMVKRDDIKSACLSFVRTSWATFDRISQVK